MVRHRKTSYLELEKYAVSTIFLNLKHVNWHLIYFRPPCMFVSIVLQDPRIPSRKRLSKRSSLRGATTGSMPGAKTNLNPCLGAAQTGSVSDLRSLTRSIPYISWASRKVGRMLRFIWRIIAQFNHCCDVTTEYCVPIDVK